MAHVSACVLLALGSMLAAGDGRANVSQLDGSVSAPMSGNSSGDLDPSAEETMDFGIFAPGRGVRDVEAELGPTLLPLVSTGSPPSRVAADESGVRAMFGEAAVDNACTKVCSGTGRFSVNQDRVSKDRLYRAYITQGAVRWSKQRLRNLGSRQVSHHSVTNTAASDVISEVKLTSTKASSVQMSTTNTISIGREFTAEITIPEVARVSKRNSFTFSTSRTQSKTDTETLENWNTVSASVPAHSTICISLEVDHETYEADFSLPVCYTGWFKCNFGYWNWLGRWKWGKCNGHWWYYARFSYIFGSRASCKTLRGKVAGNRYTNARAHVSPGACPRHLSTGGAADAAASVASPLAQEPPVVV